MFGQKNNNEKIKDFQVFTIFDTKAGFYRKPMIAENEFDIMREYQSMCLNPQLTDVIVTNAEDFQVFRIGWFNKKEGLMVGNEPEHVFNLHELKYAALKAKNGPLGIVST